MVSSENALHLCGVLLCIRTLLEYIVKYKTQPVLGVGRISN